MDAATIIMLGKIVSDLVVVITLGLPNVTGLTDDEKKAMLTTLQGDTTKLMSALLAVANKS